MSRNFRSAFVQTLEGRQLFTVVTYSDTGELAKGVSINGTRQVEDSVPAVVMQSAPLSAPAVSTRAVKAAAVPAGTVSLDGTGALSIVAEGLVKTTVTLTMRDPDPSDPELKVLSVEINPSSGETIAYDLFGDLSQVSFVQISAGVNAVKSLRFVVDNTATLSSGFQMFIVGGPAGDRVIFSNNTVSATVFGNGGPDDIIVDQRSPLQYRSQDNVFYGGPGNDTIVDGAGNSQLSGDDGRDKLYGRQGNDTLFGGAGNDQLFGFDGDDFFFGGPGADKYVGGSGQNTFGIESDEDSRTYIYTVNASDVLNITADTDLTKVFMSGNLVINVI